MLLEHLVGLLELPDDVVPQRAAARHPLELLEVLLDRLPAFVSPRV
ncbi:hypothetical protein ACO229_14125 [Promicromonospora sp. MS192]